MVAYVIPVIGIALGFLVLDETIDGRVVIGTLAILVGIAIVNGRYGRRRVFGAPGEAPTTVRQSPSARLSCHRCRTRWPGPGSTTSIAASHSMGPTDHAARRSRPSFGRVVVVGPAPRPRPRTPIR